MAGDPFLIGDNPGAEPAVAALMDSVVVVVYESDSKVVFSIPGLVSESPVAPLGTGVQASPDVAALPDSGFVAVWLAGPEGGLDPLARIFDRNGSPVSEVIDCGGQGHGVDLAVAAYPGGGFTVPGFVVSWAELWPPSIEDVFVRLHGASGAPAGPVLQANEDGIVRNNHPQVAAAPDGNFTVVWGTNDIDNSTCLARRYDGGDWDEVHLLSAAGVFPDAGVDAVGDVLTAWAASDGKQNVWCLPPGGTAYAVGGGAAWRGDHAQWAGPLRLGGFRYGKDPGPVVGRTGRAGVAEELGISEGALAVIRLQGEVASRLG
jgi:hypothetical protein